jgi:cyclohexyl-isocyanide hydratase
VPAGIDFGLALVAQLRGEKAARLTQLTMEYDPKPPFDAGSPEGAGPEVTALARSFIEPVHARTLRIARTWREQRASA